MKWFDSELESSFKLLNKQSHSVHQAAFTLQSLTGFIPKCP